MRIYVKLLLYIISSSLIVSLLVIGTIGFYQNKRASADALRMVDLEADKFALSVKTELDESFAILKNLSIIAMSHDKVTVEQRKVIFKELLENLLQENKNTNAIALFWELNAIDTTYLAPYGRLLTGFYRSAGELRYSSQTMDLENDDISSAYYVMKTTTKPIWVGPKFFQYSPRDPQKWITTLGMPVIKKGHFMGATEVDISMERFQEFINEAKSEWGNNAFLIAADGTVISSEQDTVFRKNISEIFENETVDYQLFQKIKRGEKVSFMRTEGGDHVYYAITPLELANTGLRWAVGISIPMATVHKGARNSLYVSLGVGGIGVVFLVILLWIVTRSLTKPLRNITEVLHDIAIGILPEVQFESNGSKNEFSRIYASLAKLRENLSSKNDFAQEISKGNYNADFKLSSESDFLGRSLFELRENLKQAAEEEKKRKEFDERLNWASRGYNAYNELISQHQQSFDRFTKETIVWLTKFTEMAIGGLYLVEHGKNRSIRLYASHNYNRENKKRRLISFGEGLVGRCAEENETIYITDLPEEYIKISSGLGEDTAKYLLLVPLRLNQQAFGVIELASFMPIEDFRIEFVEKIGENIAATVMNMQSTEQAADLLKKQRSQSKEGREQEKRLQETIDELYREKDILESKVALSEQLRDIYFKNQAAMELHFDGTIIRCNDRFELLLGYTSEELQDKNIEVLLAKHEVIDLKGYVDHVLEKRGLKRQIRFLEKGDVVRNLISYWGLINVENEAYIVIYFADISEIQMLSDESGRVIAQLKEENGALRKQLQQIEQDSTKGKN